MNQEFGELLKDRRVARGLSQRALAEKLAELGFPIDPSAITRMETGQREPKLSEAMTLCDYLDIDLAVLDYGRNSLAYHGAVEAASHSYLEARKALRRFINDAEYVYMVHRPDLNSQVNPPNTHEEVLEYIIAVLQKQRSTENERLVAPTEGHIDAAFRQALLSEVLEDLEEAGDGES
ncbi:helix-turn-helix transcriptional regulator [Rhodococcus sp. IEGM 1330]|uniref:helix-turn-helix domain-containing protein n=1 Tax=Rhodococcus sp. IEGM 1330 TaxID=3082225 RepID=UPI002955D369|nr:helix-turn-helix transcriptional regulator [Rhodococcus sp. IEGM 1330]MDV8024010.1 helix-turn-helix transcriptional regulator [Rhodococcus sp. IEGM 1330]